MSVNRRFVLKGAALSSIGLTVDGFIPALAANSDAPIDDCNYGANNVGARKRGRG